MGNDVVNIQRNATIGSKVIGGVTANDRGGATALLPRSINGTLPSGTRFVEFVLTNRVVTGMNDASADDLAFVLTPTPDALFSIASLARTTIGWRVEFSAMTNRFYTLERSENLALWNEVTSGTPGQDGAMSLTDTNAPDGQAFYRVACRRP